MSDLRSLVRRGRDLDRAIKDQTDELKAIKLKLILAGAGDYAGTDGAGAKVTFPARTLKPDEAAYEFACSKLERDGFVPGRLFETVTTHRPIKGFREALRILLPASDAEEVISRCEVDSAPQVRFS